MHIVMLLLVLYFQLTVLKMQLSYILICYVHKLFSFCGGHLVPHDLMHYKWVLGGHLIGLFRIRNQKLTVNFISSVLKFW